jgi:hypothetical protein
LRRFPTASALASLAIAAEAFLPFLDLSLRLLFLDFQLNFIVILLVKAAATLMFHEILGHRCKSLEL